MNGGMQIEDRTILEFTHCSILCETHSGFSIGW